MHIFLHIWLAVTDIFSMHIYASCKLQCGTIRGFLFIYTILDHKIRRGWSFVKWVKNILHDIYVAFKRA